MTRWHGRMIASGFAPMAAPSAWIRSRGTPSWAASWAYVMVVPYRTESRARQTCRRSCFQARNLRRGKLAGFGQGDDGSRNVLRRHRQDADRPCS